MAIVTIIGAGKPDSKDCSMQHVDEIICRKKTVNLPWENFSFAYEK